MFRQRAHRLRQREELAEAECQSPCRGRGEQSHQQNGG